MLSFPEPKGKRRRRILLSTIGIVAVLMAGIVAAAVYSPVLALRTVTVEGTKLLHAGAGPGRPRAAAGQTAAADQRGGRHGRC